uniref:2-C-methyl-D-erythritol 2,4-cyclodiphosphate synthase n=1 Tax=Pinguiococcus pyrenoidosus TaxID=172671 RepID=A0A7R9U3H3_9STRA|mmetsp:Transcript_12754/g.47108  ORF Transcript_12754/g.47108 Transcript_12754/m.47108 type:complete len:204 (+) Transcript_12754:56-667(+)
MARIVLLSILVSTFGLCVGFSPQLCSRRRVPGGLKATQEVAEEPLLRIGHGFDIHRMAPGKKLVIGGVTIDFELGVEAHSDGDVIYHSVVDAILGALTLPDIGQLFPDNDPEWSGADSSIFMKEAYKRMDARGYRIGNVDVTLILQKPKVKDFKPLMKDNIVELLHTTPDRVNVKARTHEKVDSVGESRALSCHVVTILERKP